MHQIIGVDFDNTLVSYDDLLERLASERGLVPADTAPGKKTIRDSIRQLPEGETEWQKLQGVVYGPRMNEAQLIGGVPEFFQACRQHGVRSVIVSHKTEYAGYDDTRTNLRQSALSWMEAHRFFESDGLGLRREDVHFAGTRAEKIAAIKQIGCTLFIDDLEETYLEPTFPSNVEKLLFAPRGHAPLPGVRVCRTWREIMDYVFHSDAFSRLLGQPVTDLEWVGGGGNSRIYKLPGPRAGQGLLRPTPVEDGARRVAVSLATRRALHSPTGRGGSSLHVGSVRIHRWGEAGCQRRDGRGH